MKRLPLYSCTSLAGFFCLIGVQVLIVNVISIVQAANDPWSTAEQLLNGLEGDLNRFVAAIEANSRNCSALSGCSSSDEGCSRLSCYGYSDPARSNYICVNVVNNSALCGPTCGFKNVDYSRGYIKPADKDEGRISRTVCTHRHLDDYFKNSYMNDSSHFFRAFFGAVDGTMRIYPGVDEQCPSFYDNRVRTWYIQSISVPKVVTVLIDSGLHMRDPTTHSTQSYLDRAVNTTLQILMTLAEAGTDFVNIICFDGDGKLKPQNPMYTRFNQTQIQPISNSLAAVVGTPAVTNPTALDTSHAINAAISQLNTSIPSVSMSIPKEYLKVVIVLTSGLQFQIPSDTLSELSIPANSGANLFVYNFRLPNQTAECNPVVRASSEGILDERIDNSLYAIESYYSFLGKVHRDFYGAPIDYGQRHVDGSGIDTNAMALGKAAFGPNGELLGVVGIDIFEEKIGEQFSNITFSSIVDAARKRDPQTSKAFDTSTDLVTSVCFNHTGACPGLNNAVATGICQSKSNADSRVGCCGQCNANFADNATSSSGRSKLIGGAVAGVFAGLILAVAAIYLAGCHVRRRRDHAKTAFVGKESAKDVEKQPTGMIVEGAKAYTLAEITEFSQNFKTKIGEGGFGPVYYGKLPSGKEVAIKVSSVNSSQGVDEFNNEVQLLSRVHHKNLVSLVGYCEDDKNQMLVYEFLRGGTVREHLYGSPLALEEPLDWKTRLDVAVNSAQGLEYLHTGCTPSIIHRDIKSSNILLTDKYVAKVADFGLSKLRPEDGAGVSHISTIVKGTAGYLDPEYYSSSNLTEKSDVFSFGVVLLELLCGWPPIDTSLADRSQWNIVDRARKALQAGDIDSILDPAVKKSSPNMDSVWKVAEVAIESVEPRSAHRPTMREVVHELRAAIQLEFGHSGADLSNTIIRTHFQTPSPNPPGTNAPDYSNEGFDSVNFVDTISLPNAR